MNSKNNHKKPHIVFYFSDTGGGHRSAAEAIIETLQAEYGNSFTAEMVDFFKEYAPPPFRQMPDLYPEMVKAPRLWQASFYATDGRAQARSSQPRCGLWRAMRYAASSAIIPQI